MTLFREGALVEDDWTRITYDEPLPTSGKIVLVKARLLADAEALRGRNAPLGLALASGETLDGLEALIPTLSLVILDIPRYSDGRLYSIARLLRERHAYRGELRAAGDVLRDQIMALHRVGVDSFDVTHPGTIAALRDKTIVAVRDHYQVAAREDEEERPGVRPWRRVSRGGSVPGLS
jgi:uncharacterized protein (DUF934 family)